MAQELKPARRPTLLAVILLVALVSAVFYPIPGFEFVDLDVPGQVTGNPHIRGLTVENLNHVFTSRCVTSYYPVRTLTYAIDYQFWKLNPQGFKLTNLLIHLTNVLLVFWLLLRLFRRGARPDQRRGIGWDVSVAALAAGIFAVHPVVVEPVTWVAGREELLMVLGALGCLHFHLSARRLSEEGGSRRRVLAYHAGAAFCCAVACLSNAVAAVIPALITAWDLLTLAGPEEWPKNEFRIPEGGSPIFAAQKSGQSPSSSFARSKLWKIVYGTSALWAIGAAAVVLKKLGEATDPYQPEFPVLSAKRLMVVLNVYWLNLKTLVWPRNLAVDYWNVDPGRFTDPQVILGATALGLTCLVVWLLRRQTLALFGLVWFVLALGPTAQIMPHHIDRADRFLYLPLVGLVVAAAVGLRPLGKALKSDDALAGVIAAGVLGLIVLGLRSADQVQTWRNSISMWQHCVKLVPANAFAHSCLAGDLADEGRFDEAIPHYEQALKVEPDNPETLNAFADRLASYRQEELRDYGRAIRLATRACELTGWQNPEFRRTLAMAYIQLATVLKRKGRFDRAIQNFNHARRAAPDYELPLFNLAMLLATCSDPEFRRPDEAVRLAERACAMLDEPRPLQLAILADVYAEAGRFDQAITTTERAIQIARADDDPETAHQLQGRMERYRSQSVSSKQGDYLPSPSGKGAGGEGRSQQGR